METDRLVLREPEAADAALLLGYYRRNAERFRPWEPERPNDLGAHERWIERVREERRQLGHAVFLALAKDSPDLVGVVALEILTTEGPRAGMLSYTVDEQYEGRGYASEALRGVIRYGFETLALDELSAYYHPDNVRSAKLLGRLGFSIVATTPVVPGFERFMRPQVVAVLRAAATR